MCSGSAADSVQHFSLSLCVCVCICAQLMAAADQFLLESMRHQCEAFLSEQVDHEVGENERVVGMIKEEREKDKVFLVLLLLLHYKDSQITRRHVKA